MCSGTPSSCDSIRRVPPDFDGELIGAAGRMRDDSGRVWNDISGNSPAID